MIDGFDREWITTGNHRVLVTCRNGFPTDRHRWAVCKVARIVDQMLSPEARLLCLFDDDKHSVFHFTIWTTNPLDMGKEGEINDRIYSETNPTAHPVIDIECYERGRVESDHYCYMHHLWNKHFLSQEIS